MQIHILISLIIVTMKFWTVTITVLSQQLVHVNNCDLSATAVTSDSETHTSVTALNIKQFVNAVNGFTIDISF